MVYKNLEKKIKKGEIMDIKVYKMRKEKKVIYNEKKNEEVKKKGFIVDKKGNIK